MLYSVLSSFLASWVMNGGYTTIYYKFGQYGLLWAILEWPILFLSTVRSHQNNERSLDKMSSS
jgi:hypothetical protein